jgi:hypothetical protein
VVFEEGKLIRIRVEMNADTILAQTIAKLGQPERMGISGGFRETYLHLNYPTLGLAVVHRNDENNRAMAGLIDDFKVDRLYYYSPDVLKQIRPHQVIDIFGYPVADETWQKWLKGDINGSYSHILGRFLLDLATATQAARLTQTPPAATPTPSPTGRP